MVDDSACLSRICRGDNFCVVCTVQDMYISGLSNPRLSIYATNEDLHLHEWGTVFLPPVFYGL